MDNQAVGRAEMQADKDVGTSEVPCFYDVVFLQNSGVKSEDFCFLCSCSLGYIGFCKLIFFVSTGVKCESELNKPL